MVCDDYREGMMALLDGEAGDIERAALESHVRICPHCLQEWDRFQRLQDLTSTFQFSAPTPVVWEHYYIGVCRKLNVAGSWAVWSAGALLLALTGMLMLFGFSACPLASLLGGIALLSGVGLLWLSYFCNCKR